MAKVFHICQEIAPGRIVPVNGDCDNFNYLIGCMGHDECEPEHDSPHFNPWQHVTDSADELETCPECGSISFTYVDQYANGKCWRCNECERETIFPF